MTVSHNASERPESQAPHHPDRLAHDDLGHLALPLGAVDEHDRYLYDLEVLSPRAKAHLDLKCITVRAHMSEIDGLENFSTEALEPTSRIPQRKSSDDARVDVGEVAQQ